MQYLILLCLLIFNLNASDLTLDISKQVDSLPSLVIENGSDINNKLNKKFQRSLISDMNVLSIFNVNRKSLNVDFDDNEVSRENKKINYVLRFKIEPLDASSYRTEIKFFEHNKIILQKNYTINREKLYVFVAHAIAYDINEAMGEESIDWIKKKVVISRLSARNQSEIIITDYTLTYQHIIIKGGLNVFPQWANERQSALYYTSLSDFKPTLYRLDTKTGKKKKIISSDGMMVCSDVREDGKKLLLTMAPNGQPDIYLYDVRSGKYQRLTHYSGIDVSAQFMDNNNIVFISNRMGYPNVFSKRIGSKSVEQMVYYGKSNVACSAHKEYIVYKSRETSNAFSSNTFNLHLISTKTDFIRRLTATGVNEFPRFSKDGSAILFIKNYKNQSSIGVVRLAHNKNYLFPLKMGKIQSLDW
ncbi:MAG: Tol-Pal system protein TolB [Campylobacterota bacterium]|nr:Tol-Pal system protein TolB [Campylobacterota bacterium]